MHHQQPSAKLIIRELLKINLNCSLFCSGDLTTRIVWSIVAMVVIFIMTIVLAMVDSSNWPGAFFWITMITVVALNSEHKSILLVFV